MISGEGQNCITKCRNLLAIGNNCKGRVAKCKEWTKEAIPKIVLEKTVNQQLKNSLMKLQRHLGFGGLELLSRLNEVNDHIISYLQIYF